MRANQYRPREKFPSNTAEGFFQKKGEKKELSYWDKKIRGPLILLYDNRQCFLF